MRRLGKRSALLLVASALAATVAAATTTACNGILGISAAALDPTLEDAGAVDAPVDVAVPDTNVPETIDPFSCAAYCNTLATNCTDTNQEYTSPDTCNAICRNFEPGVAGEKTNDSLACRIYHANEAATDAGGNCQAAGPLAAGTCTSDPCASFCALAFDLCGPLKLFPYATNQDCRTACARWPYLRSTDPDAGMVGDILFAAGDTLNCRIYHLESAYEVGNPSAPTIHCPHLGDPSATCTN